ncbi:unnamed protein product, partial [Symbiodinium sp. KB8]
LLPTVVVMMITVTNMTRNTITVAVLLKADSDDGGIFDGVDEHAMSIQHAYASDGEEESEEEEESSEGENQGRLGNEAKRSEQLAEAGGNEAEEEGGVGIGAAWQVSLAQVKLRRRERLEMQRIRLPSFRGLGLEDEGNSEEEGTEAGNTQEAAILLASMNASKSSIGGPGLGPQAPHVGHGGAVKLEFRAPGTVHEWRSMATDPSLLKQAQEEERNLEFEAEKAFIAAAKRRAARLAAKRKANALNRSLANVLEAPEEGGGSGVGGHRHQGGGAVEAEEKEEE